MANSVLKNAALHYADLGFAVFPLKEHDKVPATHDGFKSATTDKGQIRKWWNRNPDYNIGLATGQVSGGVVVVDIDVNEETGVDGRDSLAEWERDNGRLPDTAIAITGRGGYHYYYRTEKVIKNRTSVIEGVDFRGDGGYVVAPPSVHKNGNEYEWEYDVDEFPIALADSKVEKLLSSAMKSTGGELTEWERFDPVAAIAEGGRNNGLFKCAAHYQSLEYRDDDICTLVHQANLINCKPPLEDAEVNKIIRSALSLNKGKSEEYLSSVKAQYGKDRQKISDMVECIENDELLSTAIKYNSLAYVPWIAGELPWSPLTQREWTDSDDANFYAYMEDYGFKSHDKMDKALQIVMEKQKFSPIREHLDTLRGTWDGVRRTRTLLQDFLGADDTPLNQEIMRLFMFGAIARAYTPGCQFDYMLILVGEQGIGKSTFLRRLAMSDSWFDGNFNTIDGTQAVERLRGMWLVEMSELLAMKRSKEIEAMKSFVTNRADNYRQPYARRTTARPRQCVFAGSTNDNHFLTDTTGNRRFLPVLTHADNVKRDLFGGKEIDEYFQQAWAEALTEYEELKPKLVLSKDMQKAIKEVQEEFTEEDVRIGIIQAYLDRINTNRTCVADIWEHALNEYGRPDKKTGNQLHDIMKLKIKNWKLVGKQRCGEYGVQTCYERVDEGATEGRKVPFIEDDVIPF